MSKSAYEDHGSPVRRARDEARGQLPCRRCGNDGEPSLRRPRHLSEAWYLDPAAYFGCMNCDQKLTAIGGSAATRASDIAEDGIPDPEGTLRALMTRDPLVFIDFDPATEPPVSLPLRPILGLPLAGIELRSEVAVIFSGRSEQVAPFAFTRHGLPWVVIGAVQSEDALEPPIDVASCGLELLLEDGSVEAAFIVVVDQRAGWQVIKLRPRVDSALEPGNQTAG